MAGAHWEDEWELCNDDGFVYKRKKRRQDSDALAPPSAPAPAPAPDPEAEERHRRERKKSTLMKLRDQYQREIDHWEFLSNTLREIQEKTLQQQQQQEQQHSSSLSSTELPLLQLQTPESVCRPLVDELLLQAEAQEAIIQDISNLCDVAEAMCEAQEDRVKQSFIDLPVWGTPRALMASLSDD
ncbi:hypothetical protein HHK36_015662 [Tetracentron sinense]|uniref:Uncharacterized protein n=1 Tax=Tetracentron sinense TaxID=13715 RepID=A0A834Z5J4_TETSI|nr:hypothetical protein HHK36_015662 [Tetracentron sinense]